MQNKSAVKLMQKAKTILLVTHDCPDPDAIGACGALAKALNSLGKKSTAFAGGVINEQARNLLRHAKFKFADKPDYNVDLIVVLDTNSPNLFDFESVKKSKAKKILIDHHHPKKEVSNEFDEVIVDECAVSATQIVYHIIKSLGAKPDPNISLCISAGIVTDSANFIAATTDSFEVLLRSLCEGNITFQEVLRAISVPRDISEKIARLKAAQRIQFKRQGEWVVAFSNVSCFEGSTASALLRLGADVAFVGAAKDNEIRISARAKTALKEHGLHLGRDIMPLISELIQGDAGGHAAAAGANGVNTAALDKALNICVEKTIGFLKSI